MRGNLGTALLHFLEVFGLRFNYDRVGICLTNGGSFFEKRQRGWSDPSRPHLLCVENPLDTSHDVGANSYNVVNVRRAFRHAYFTLLAPDAADGTRGAGGRAGSSSGRRGGARLVALG